MYDSVRRAIGILAAAAVMSAASEVRAQSPTELRDLTIEQLLDVAVSRVFGASERLQPVTEAPASVTIVRAGDIARCGCRTLAEVLRGVRGFYVNNDRNYSYLGVRGFGRPGDYNSRTLLLVNGHRVNDNIYDQAYVGAELGIDVAMIDRVEIIRGPASALYGTSAFFAVVNVITRGGRSFNGPAVAIDGGSLGREQVRAAFGRAFGSVVDVAVAGTFERSDGLRRFYQPAFDTPSTNGGVAEDLDGERAGQFYGRLNAGGFALTGTYGRRRKYVPTASYFTLFNSHDPREQTSDRRLMIDAQYDTTRRGTRVALDIGFDRFAYDGIYPFAPATANGAATVNEDGSLGTRWSAGARVTRTMAGRQTVTAGGELLANVTQRQWSRYSDPSLPPLSTDRAANQSAIYLQDEVRVQPWLILNAGIRRDAYRRFARTTPRGAAIVMPSPNQSFKYLYGRSFRAPNAYELYYYGDASARLRPESIATHEWVWENYLGSWLRTSASAYSSNVSGLIQLSVDQPDAQSTVYRFVNAGRVRARGVEAEVELRFKPKVEVLATYARQQARDRDGQLLTNSPREIGKLRVNMPVPAAPAWASVEVLALSARRTVAGTTVPPSVVSYLTLGARVHGSWQVIASAQNLFDRRNVDPASDEHLADRIVQDGRTIRVSLRWTLDRNAPISGETP